MENNINEQVEKEVETPEVESVKEEVLSKKDANALCKTLKEENAKLTEEVADLKDKWLRNVAEFDNYKKT
jgi:molecular chaperone GrpE